MMLAEACIFLFLLAVCCFCPGSAHPALVTLVRIISLLDPLIAHHESKLNTSPAEAPSTIREKSLPTVGLNDLEERVRSLFDSGVNVDLITAAVNSGLGASGQMVTLENAVNEFTFDAQKVSTTSPLIRDDVDELVRYSMILDGPSEDNNFIERSNRDPFFLQSSSNSEYVNKLDNNALRNTNHRSNTRPQLPLPPKPLSHRRAKPSHLPGRRHSSSSSSMDDWPQFGFPFNSPHGPPGFVRVEVLPGHVLQAPVVSLIDCSPTMNEVDALFSAENTYLAEHPEDIESPFKIQLTRSEFKHCFVLASVGGVQADAERHWNIRITDANNKVESSGECVRQIHIFPGYTISLNFTEDEAGPPGRASYR